MIKRQEVIFVVFLIITGVMGMICNNTATFFCAMIIFFVGFIFMFKDLEENVFLIAFMISFFTFLLGSELFCLLGIEENKYHFPDDINNHTYLTIIISLLFLLLSYICTNVYLRKHYLNDSREEALPPRLLTVRKVSLLVFYFLLIFKVIVNLSEVLFARTFGYSSFYTDYYFQGPSFFIKLADMCTTSFFIFLGTLPTKKECRVPVLLYICANLIILFSGRRNDLITALLLVFVYYCVRNILYSYDEVWISRKSILLLILIAPLLLSVLYAISSLRFEREGNIAISYFKGISDFFYQQGFSINIIKWEKSLENSIPDRLYSLGQLYEFFTTRNFVSRLLFDFKSYSGQTVERAMEGHRLSYLLSYLVFPWSYSHGYGIGSSYIAEAYHDFGYIGVAVFNCIYGYLFARFNYIKYRGPVIMAISFLMMQKLLLAPRSYADAFIGSILDLSNIEILLFILLLARYVYNHHDAFKQPVKDAY